MALYDDIKTIIDLKEFIADHNGYGIDTVMAAIDRLSEANIVEVSATKLSDDECDYYDCSFNQDIASNNGVLIVKDEEDV